MKFGIHSLLFKETFIEKSVQEKSKGDILELDDLPREKKYVIDMLRNGNPHEKVEAIIIILENRITEAISDLEYLLGYDDEKVMNGAYDAILVLKNLE